MTVAPLTICPLASGSSGNAIYISDGATSILLDAGLSGKEIERRMAARGLSARSLDAILVSHEHADHIRGVGILSRRYGLPVYLSAGTLGGAKDAMGKLADAREFACGRKFNINTLGLRPFSISHDADDPAGFTISTKRVKIGIATDLGVATSVVRQQLKGCDLLLLEANHDAHMLMDGPYPWHLKQRVRGRTGHLSNDDCAALLRELLHDRLRHVILCHLSQQNNTPETAMAAVGTALNGSRARLGVALQDRPGDVIAL